MVAKKDYKQIKGRDTGWGEQMYKGGYERGHSEGYLEGYDDGYDQGWDDGWDKAKGKEEK